jgi:hypothetical protein
MDITAIANLDIQKIMGSMGYTPDEVLRMSAGDFSPVKAKTYVDSSIDAMKLTKFYLKNHNPKIIDWIFEKNTRGGLSQKEATAVSWDIKEFTDKAIERGKVTKSTFTVKELPENDCVLIKNQNTHFLVMRVLNEDYYIIHTPQLD